MRYFAAFDGHLRERGYLPMGGQIVDATPLAGPTQRTTATEKDAIKAGRAAAEIWPDKPAKAAQKDTDARWTLKFAKATFATLAHVVVSKFDHHLPLYRQAEMMTAQGLDIDRSTLAGWTGQAAALLDPIVSRIRDEVLKADKIHADDTPVPVLDPGRGKTATGRLWVYAADDRASGSTAPRATWYRFTPDRTAAHPLAHLAGFRGFLQADAYAGYDGLYRSGVTEVACWAHFRRKVFDLHERSPTPLTTDILERILGATGLLKGRHAACHWGWRHLLPLFGAIPDDARVVRDGPVITGGGVTAGIDFALTVLAEIAGPETAQTIQLGLEYAPEPPFDAGRPDTAPPTVLAACRARFGGMMARREAEARQAAGRLGLDQE